MGEVYRARDLTTDVLVALKLLAPGGGAPERQRFSREAQVLRDLRHPNIVRYIDHGMTEEHRPYLVMEWLEGEDLETRLRRGALPFGATLSLLRGLCDGLAAAHSAGVIHRDIKPSNIFLRGGDCARAVLLDFGLARRTKAPPMTATGALLGTPAYMAPEQARGACELTPAADVFALGCVFFECLTGQPPFVGQHIPAGPL
jgi:serine/threonine protein kinase